MADKAPTPANSFASVMAGVSFPDPTEAAALDGVKRDEALKAARATAAELKETIRGTRDRKGRIRQAKFVAAVLALRFEGFREHGEIAQILGCSVQQVSGALMRVRRDATIDQQLDRIDQIAVPLATDNVIDGIARGDKTYTLRVMDGRGLFRVHKSIDAQIKKTVITLRVDMTPPKHLPPDAPLPGPKPGSIVGASELTRDNAPALPALTTVETPSGETVAVLAAPAI